MVTEWTKNYKALLQFKAKYGAINMPLNKKYKDVYLGVWLYTQFFTQDELSQSRLGKLRFAGLTEELNSVMDLSAPKFDRNWLNSLKLLSDYKKEYGHTLLTCKETYKGFALGSWLYRNRMAYVHHELLPERELLLHELGVFLGSWETDGWAYKYYYAEKYFKRHKDLNVPMGYEVGGFNLYSWLYFQKQKHLAHTLSEEQEKQLEAIGIRWSQTYEDKWMEKYNTAKAFYEEHGSLDTERNQIVNGFNLDAWLNNQRRAKRGDKHRNISERQIELLNELGMKW